MHLISSILRLVSDERTSDVKGFIVCIPSLGSKRQCHHERTESKIQQYPLTGHGAVVQMNISQREDQGPVKGGAGESNLVDPLVS